MQMSPCRSLPTRHSPAGLKTRPTTLPYAPYPPCRHEVPALPALPRAHRLRRPLTMEPRARDHADAAVDEVLKLVAQRRGVQRRLERDHLAVIERRQRLVHRL